MKKQKLKTIEFIPVKSFKEKIKVTKEYKDCKVEIIGNHVYVEKWTYQ